MLHPHLNFPPPLSQIHRENTFQHPIQEAYAVQHPLPADGDANWQAGEGVRSQGRGGGTVDVHRQTHGVPDGSWGACALPKLPFNLKMDVNGKTERENNANLKFSLQHQPLARSISANNYELQLCARHPFTGNAHRLQFDKPLEYSCCSLEYQAVIYSRHLLSITETGQIHLKYTAPPTHTHTDFPERVPQKTPL